MSKRILILGKGYVGQSLFNHLRGDPHNNIGDIRIVSKSVVDYHDEDTLRKFLDDIEFGDFAYDLSGEDDVIINCSGFTGRPNIDQCEELQDETLHLNVNVPKMINSLCNEFNIQYYHISSGCVYTGYDHPWTEEDKPNFGPILEETSFYSHSKYLFESQAENCAILRLRMPFDDKFNHRSYLTKITGYDNLIACPNSKTYLNTLLEVIVALLQSGKTASEIGILNIVNSNALDTNDVCDILKEYGLHNLNWNMIKPEDLDTAAPRSNCRLSNDKLKSILPNYKILTEAEALHKCCKAYKASKS